MRLAISLTALAMLLALTAFACTREVEVPGQTVVKEVVKVETVEVPGQTVVKEVVKTIEVPGQTVVKEVVKTVEVPGQTVIKEVVKEVVVEKPIEVVKTEIREVIIEKPITQIKETVIIATPSPADQAMDMRIVPAGTFTGAIGSFSPVSGWGPSCTACSQLVGASVGEALFATARDESGAIGLTPWLVEKWELAADASYSDFKLQEGVQFHQDFGELTADDVAWYFNLINTNTNPESKHDTGVQIFDLAMAEVIDRYTVRFNWASYGGYTLMMEFTDLQEGVETMSKKAFDTRGQEWMSENVPITTGPFEVQKWTQGEEIRLIAVPDHWRKTSNIARVSILSVSEGTTRRAMLESGQAHGAQIGLKDMPAMINSGFKLAPELIQNQVNLGFGGNYWESVHAKTGEPLERTRDTSVPWVGDPYENGDTYDENTPSMQNSRKVRWALSQSIDRDLIAETVLSDLGWGFPVGHMSTDDPLYLQNPGRWDVPYDPEAARALLDEAGHGGCNGLTPIVWTGPSGVGVEVWDAVGVMWQTDLNCTAQFDRTDYYAQHRPGIVARTSINIYSGCCPGMGIWPMEWSFSSDNFPGGFGVGIETPTHSRIYTTKKETSDPDAVIQLGLDQHDFNHHWQIFSGIVRFPDGSMYDPQTVYWEDMRPFQWNKIGGLRSFEDAKLVE
jgi:ABC-type transport system substrate-binding protein